MTAPISKSLPAVFKPYLQELRSGSNFGLDGISYFTNNIGVGIQYSIFHTKNKDNVTLDSLGKPVVGIMSDNITIQYIGPSLSSRYILGRNENVHLVAVVSLGYMSYKNNAVAINSFTIRSGTIGATAAFGADVALSRNIFLGAKFALIGGTLDHYEIDNGTTPKRVELDEDKKEGLARIDLSAGLRFNF